MINILKRSAQLATDVYSKSVKLKKCNLRIDIDNRSGIFYLTFRGTNKTWKDWWRNFNLRKVYHYKKHAWESASEAYTYIHNAGYDTKFKKYVKSIQGHSQGGPEAGTFYEEYCKQKDYCFMYDPPPYRKGKKILGENAYIIVNDKSVVRHLGFITFDLPICNWWHFDAYGRLRKNLNWKEMRQIARDQKGSVTELVGDHPMPKINKLIQKL